MDSFLKAFEKTGGRGKGGAISMALVQNNYDWVQLGVPVKPSR